MSRVHHNGRDQSFEKAQSGCLGRMVNLFELNLGVTSNRLLTDKPHRDGAQGSPLTRSRSDVSRMSPPDDQIEEKMVVPEFKNNYSNRKSNGTPMKMLIAHEMSKDVDSRRSPPNLVAKLMGLDALPPPDPDSVMMKSQSRGHPRSQSDIPLNYWEQENGCFHYVEPPNEYKDVHEIWQRSPKSPHKARCDEVTNKKKMALVRQKFNEAKRMSMDIKLRQTKQFEDALEVLNSNKDLFIKCLQEPNAMLSEHLHSLQALQPPVETKRITVLKPSKMVDNSKRSGDGNKDGKQMAAGAFVQLNGSDKFHLGSPNHDNPSQHTRIVVLKPSPGKPHDLKAVGSPQSGSPRIFHGEDFSGDLEDDENQESREVAKAITQQMREKLGRHRRDETLISSVFSNGYIGDESSFNKSEMDYDAGNLSDSEVISPVSRHSWDYVNRLCSPFSSSSFSRASYSPESSVCREAKKRLSERWAMMASNGSYPEQRHVRRSSSTLGEMLALSEAKKTAVPVENSVSSEESKDVNSPIVNEQMTGEISDNSPRNLTRSKSVPVSSIEFGSRLNVDIPASDDGKTEILKEKRKAKNSKSLKGKVSSLFFSRNKKVSKDKSIASETKDQMESSSRELGCNGSESVSGKGPNHLSLGVMDPSSKPSFRNLIDKQNMSTHENGFFMPETSALANPGENQDQPSPISVLDLPFEEDIETSKFLSHVRPEQQGVELPLNCLGSNLIDKSPPIGSIARTLSWDESCVDTASSYPVKESLATRGTEEEEQELYFFVKTLLTVAGLEDAVQSNSSYMTRWHSPDSPLDPSLRDTYIDLKDKETLHEAKRRQKRSIRKLIFDCVNVALLEISGYDSGSGQRPSICVLNNEATLLDEVWGRLTVWFRGDRCVSDDGDDSNLVVERVVKKEVVGSGWSNNLRMEVDTVGREIEGDLLEELVQETVAILTGRT